MREANTTPTVFTRFLNLLMRNGLSVINKEPQFIALTQLIGESDPDELSRAMTQTIQDGKYKGKTLLFTMMEILNNADRLTVQLVTEFTTAALNLCRANTLSPGRDGLNLLLSMYYTPLQTPPLVTAFIEKCDPTSVFMLDSLIDSLRHLCYCSRVIDDASTKISTCLTIVTSVIHKFNALSLSQDLLYRLLMTILDEDRGPRLDKTNIANCLKLVLTLTVKFSVRINQLIQLHLDGITLLDALKNNKKEFKPLLKEYMEKLSLEELKKQTAPTTFLGEWVDVKTSIFSSKKSQTDTRVWVNSLIERKRSEIPAVTHAVNATQPAKEESLSPLQVSPLKIAETTKPEQPRQLSHNEAFYRELDTVYQCTFFTTGRVSSPERKTLSFTNTIPDLLGENLSEKEAKEEWRAAQNKAFEMAMYSDESSHPVIDTSSSAVIAAADNSEPDWYAFFTNLTVPAHQPPSKKSQEEEQTTPARTLAPGS